MSDSRLGMHLRLLRTSRGLSLRDVEEETGISNAYISQLENGDSDHPSPLKLRQLADCYEVPYVTLLHVAGYLQEGDLDGQLPAPNDS